MTILNSKLQITEKQIKIMATNGEESRAIVLDKNSKRYDIEYQRHYYKKNRDWILEKKNVYNQRPDMKIRNAHYHKKWYHNQRNKVNSN